MRSRGSRTAKTIIRISPSPTIAASSPGRRTTPVASPETTSPAPPRPSACLGDKDAQGSMRAPARDSGGPNGLVAAAHRRHYLVALDGGGTIECVLKGRATTL